MKIKGHAYVIPLSRGRVLLCLQDVLGAVYEMELGPDAAWFLVWQVRRGPGGRATLHRCCATLKAPITTAPGQSAGSY